MSENLSKYPESIYKNSQIVKVKKGFLDFNITLKPFIQIDSFDDKECRIYVDQEKIQIGKKSLKLKNLKNVYLYWDLNPSIIVVSKTGIGGFTKDLTTCEKEELEKLVQLFDFFVYSCEFESEKMHSDLYRPLIEFNAKQYKYNFLKYGAEKIIYDGENRIINKNSNIYILKGVYPKEEYKKYVSKKDYLIYESKYVNTNYIDVWQNKEIIDDKEHKSELKFNIIATIIMLILFGTIISDVVEIVFGILEHIISIFVN